MSIIFVVIWQRRVQVFHKNFQFFLQVFWNINLLRKQGLRGCNQASKLKLKNEVNSPLIFFVSPVYIFKGKYLSFILLITRFFPSQSSQCWKIRPILHKFSSCGSQLISLYDLICLCSRYAYKNLHYIDLRRAKLREKTKSCVWVESQSFFK